MDVVLQITTTNPDIEARIIRAFDQVGLDLDEAGNLHTLSAELLDAGGNLLWGTAYEPDH